jgi:Mrp family chromosome partitioning ATPase/capsular polysaccharide biosynthesis protein
MAPESSTQNAAWLKPSVEESALQRYIQTLRERKWLILATTLITTLLAGAYVATADKVYRAEADMLITPVPGGDTALNGLGLIQASSDPTRDVETASRLITTIDVARRVKQATGDPRSPRALLGQIDVAPVAQSNIVAITAEEGSAKEAQALANGFAVSAVAERTTQFRRALDTAITGLRARVGPNPSPSQAADPTSPQAQLARLEALRGGADPTMRVESLADLPASPVSPKPKLSIIAGIVAGLILGIGGAFALRVLDPRLRREEQLRSLYGLPVLARIPRDSKAHTHGALAPEQLAPATIESYRTLRATLSASRRTTSGSRAILVTSPSPSEGKTTTAINLASSLALAGNSVILIEADLRRPAVGPALGVKPEYSTGDVLLDTVDIADALVSTDAHGSYLHLLLADFQGGASGWVADRLFLPSAQTLVDDAKRLADFVIVDSPPLSEVIDALPLAQRVDDVVVVVRLGKTQLTKLSQLSELLARHSIRPAGFAVVGAPTPSGDGYYYTTPKPASSRSERRRAREAAR